MGAACGCGEGLDKFRRNAAQPDPKKAKVNSDASIGSAAQHGRKTLVFRNTNTGKHPSDQYEMAKGKDALGVGAFGTVKIGTNKKTKQVVAIKAQEKKSQKVIINLKNEIEINMALDHPNIARMYETFEDARYVWLAMELCAGGEMFDLIIAEGSLPEIGAAILMEQILRAVYYMHTRSIAHRDLKPENFLLTKKKVPFDQNTLKVIDFGIAKRFEKDSSGEGKMNLKTKAGTPYYIAPEIIAAQPQYNEKCDVWSCGVILYILLSGSPPFAGDSDRKIMDAVKRGVIAFNLPEFKTVSQQAKDLIKRCCAMKPKQRITAEQAVKDGWITQPKKGLKRQESQVQDEALILNLRKFSAVNRFKKAALHIMAHHVDEENLKKLRAKFNKLDKNGDGELTLEELKAGCKEAGLCDLQDVARVFEQLDADNSGSIGYSEFLASMIAEKDYTKRETCWEAFRVFDEDGNGRITAAEFAKILKTYEEGKVCDEKEIQKMFKDADADGDGEIDFEEFVQMMKR